MSYEEMMCIIHTCLLLMEVLVSHITVHQFLIELVNGFKLHYFRITAVILKLLCVYVLLSGQSSDLPSSEPLLLVLPLVAGLQ